MAADEGTVMKRTVSQRDQARPRSRRDQRSHLLTEPAPQFGNPQTPAGHRLSNSPGRSPLPAAGRTPQRQWDRPLTQTRS